MNAIDKIIKDTLGKIKEPSDEERADMIMKMFAPGSKLIGTDNRINFIPEEFRDFFKSLEKDKKKELIKAVYFYSGYMDKLSFLLEGKSGYQEFLNKRVWSTISILLMISILEKMIMDSNSEERPTPFEYIKENFKDIKDDKDIKKIEERYYQKYPGKGRSIANFLQNGNLSDEEIKKIISGYRNRRQEKDKLKINTLQDVINDLYRSACSGFVHNAKDDPIDNDSFWADMKNIKGKMIWIIGPNLSVYQLLFYFWLAIFRSFGFDGVVDNNFTEDEMRKGFTVSGTKI